MNETTEMNERLRQFLAMEGISPARFAEELGIQRSGMSHLLSGRNNPSFEFIQRMMTAYPDVNYEWLILGKGRPYKSDKNPAPKPANPDLFTITPEEDTEPEDLPLPEPQEVEPEKPAEYRAENRVFRDAPAPSTAFSQRKISRIIVFFNDGTYEEK